MNESIQIIQVTDHLRALENAWPEGFAMPAAEWV